MARSAPPSRLRSGISTACSRARGSGFRSRPRSSPGGSRSRAHPSWRVASSDSTRWPCSSISQQPGTSTCCFRSAALRRPRACSGWSPPSRCRGRRAGAVAGEDLVARGGERSPRVFCRRQLLGLFRALKRGESSRPSVVEPSAEVSRQHGARARGRREEPDTDARHRVVGEVARRARHEVQRDRGRAP